MGAIADGLVAFAQPLFDQTDGSPEELKKAFALSELCFHLALLPAEQRETEVIRMRATCELHGVEFDEFRRCVIDPMIERHQEMFPLMHNRVAADPWRSAPALRAQPRTTDSCKAYPGTDRYAPCPCNSGEKYKFCCGAKRR